MPNTFIKDLCNLLKSKNNYHCCKNVGKTYLDNN